jgi:hypothetical protein
MLGPYYSNFAELKTRQDKDVTLKEENHST